MKQRLVVVGLVVSCILLLTVYLANAVKKEYTPPPHSARRTALARRTEPISRGEVPTVRFQKALECTLSEFYFDGGEEEWSPHGFLAYPWHCDNFKAYSGIASWWMGDPAIGGYQDMWREILDTKPVVLPATDVRLSFRHWMRTDTPIGDGGNVKMSVNGAPFQIIFPTADPYDTSAIEAWYYHGDTVEWGWCRQAGSWSYAQFDETLNIGDIVVFRFEFASGNKTNTKDDTLWFGWVIDDIVVTSGVTTLIESDCEAPDTTMNPSLNYPESAWRKSDYDSPPTPDSSWHACDQYSRYREAALISPWIFIPDTACGESINRVEIEFRVNEYVPGAAFNDSLAALDSLKDYYSLEVMTKSTTTGWPPFPEGGDTIHYAGFWYEMFHDYDREFSHDCPSDTCDCPPNWNLQDKNRISNGYATLHAAVGDSIRLRVRWHTDSLIQPPSIICQIQGHLSGTWIDNVVITGGESLCDDSLWIVGAEGNPGDLVQVEVWLQYGGGGPSDSISGFDIPLTWDATICTVEAITIGPDFAGWTDTFRIDNIGTDGPPAVSKMLVSAYTWGPPIEPPWVEGCVHHLAATVDLRIFDTATPGDSACIDTLMQAFSPPRYLEFEDKYGIYKYVPEFSGNCVRVSDCPCGDCNRDGKVTFADALHVKNYYYQTPPGAPAPWCNCDVNLDTKVNFADALYIKNYYYQTPPGSPPPCEPPL